MEKPDPPRSYSLKDELKTALKSLPVNYMDDIARCLKKYHQRMLHEAQDASDPMEAYCRLREAQGVESVHDAFRGLADGE